MNIQLADDLAGSIEEPPPSNLLCAWAQAAWQGKENAEPVLSLRIVSLAESQQLNHDYRGENKATNVLSFPMQMDKELSRLQQHQDQDEQRQADDSLLDVEVILGDLAICAEVVEQEARQEGKLLQAHWAHMVVHGMLHLQGFDHIENNEANAMEKLEISIMQQLGFADPYQINKSDSIEFLKS